VEKEKIMVLTLVDIGKKIKSARKERGLNQRELALKSGVSLQAIRNIEQGKSMSSMRVFLALATALEKKPVILLVDYSEL